MNFSIFLLKDFCNSCVYDREHDAYTLEDLCLEMSSYGKGDIREPFVELIYEDGSFSSDFVYESSARFEGREARDAEDGLTILTSVMPRPSFSNHFKAVKCCAVPIGSSIVIPFTVSGLPSTFG